MPDISVRSRATRIGRAAARLVEAADTSLHSAPVASAAVAALAVAFAALDIGLQYVAGAFVVVFAQRLAWKRLVGSSANGREAANPIRQPKPSDVPPSLDALE